MPWYAVLIIAIAVAMALSTLWTYRQANRMKGERLGELPGGLRGIDTGRPLVIYAYSPTCGPCKAITPRVDALAETGRRIVKLDISREPEAARALNIRATPTFVLIRDGRIEEVLLGARNPARLETFLDD